MPDQPRDHADAAETDASKAAAKASSLARAISTSDRKQLTYSPGDYLFNLAAKVVVYVSDKTNPLDPELRARSFVLAALRDHVLLPTAATHSERDWVQPVLEELYNNPALQQPLAYLVNYVPSKWLLEQEAAVICQARAIHGTNPQVPWLPTPVAGPLNRCDPTTWQAPDAVYEWARKAGLRGLCLSGGGIRSATFNLGILQGLAAQQKLNRFDYLSSVSGGGYIHSWLAGWLRRESGRQQQTLPIDEAARQALKLVQEEMSPIPPAKDGGSPHLFPPHELRWLRRFSNYLTPEKGLLTLDTWTAAAIWLRNTFLNQLVLISALLCLLLVPWLLSALWRAPADACGVMEAPAPAATNYTLTMKSNLDGADVNAAMVATSRALAVPLAGTAPAGIAPLAIDGQALVTLSPVKTGNEESAVDRFKVDYCLALGLETGKLLADSTCLPSIPANVDRAEATALTCANKPRGVTLILEFLSFALFLAGSLSLGILLRQEFNFTRKLDGEEHLDEVGEPIDACKLPYIYKPQSLRDFGGPWRTRLIVASLLLPSIPFCYALCCPGPGPLEAGFAAIALLFLSICVACGGYAFCRKGSRGFSHWLIESAWKQLFAALGAALLGTAVFMLVAALIRTATVEHWGAHLMRCSVPAVELAAGLPLLASLPFLTVSLLIGLVGRNFVDWLRELLGRILAMTLLATFAWLGLFCIALLSPGLFLDAMHGTTLKVSTIAAWLATTLASVMSAKSPATDGSSAPTSKSVFNAELLATVGPYVYILGLLVVLSSLVQLWVDVEGALTRIWIAIAVCGGLSLILGWRLDATAFSLFPFYRNRLTRCYLGASNRGREPNPLTGFDDRDTRGLQLRCLTPSQGYPGPFPIFNATLNLTTGTELAYQERKGAAFAFTPLYTGYAVSWTEGAAGTQFNGFVPTETYAAPHGGLNIASAMAISGAAVSPNMGYHTKPATAFLLTMFNARLGCWLPNTRKQETSGRKDMKPVSTDIPSPNGRVLVNELTGHTDDSQDFVYLTDGGHFDNMGLYELVRRRCYHIVICDAEQDEDYIFDGIGSTIRKCRIDFGVEISLDLSHLRKVATTRFSSAHVITGTIRYPEAKADQLGEITYIKASLVTFKAATEKDSSPSDLPNVPGDVQSFYLQDKQFPHDSTLNQWFTESQFESYRRLGQAVVEAIPPLMPDPAPVVAAASGPVIAP